jgi:hypothetical protein
MSGRDDGRSLMLHISLLAAYDLGAPTALLHAIYDTERQILKPIDSPPEQVKITPNNFAKYLGQPRCVCVGEHIMVQFMNPV